MVPLHELLSRISWDSEFGRGEFRIGYLDHLRDRLVYVPLREAQRSPDNYFCLEVRDQEGILRSVPFHRVKEVWKDGLLIWKREY